MKPTLLAVDDDPIMRDIYQVILDDTYNLHLASSGKEALDFLNSYPRPDVILLDIMMPEMDGYEVCQIIRKNPLFSHLKVILVSAKSMVEERLRGYDAGADDYVTKPFEENELLAKINVFLRLKNIEEIDMIKRDFLGLLSHETRTPLNGILGFSDILHNSPNLNEEEKEFVGHIITCGKELLDLSEKTTLLSDLKLGNVTIEKLKTKMNELLADFQQKLIRSANEKQLLFQIQGDVEAEIDGDPKLLRYAFERVLENAVKFAREGTVIEVTLTEVGNRIQVDIANEGEKILDEHREAIFDEFFVHNVKQHHHGHGLSLAIARRIVGEHEGTLSVKNQDKGPIFVFDFQS